MKWVLIMKILIPPSEGKTKGGNNKALGKLTEDVFKRLSKIPIDERMLEKFYGVKRNNLDLAIDANENIKTSLTMSAIKRYTGVVYKGISYDTMTEKGQKFFENHVLITSGLFGLVKPLDLIPNYKYKMQKGKQLEINEFCIDLLPKLHHDAVKYLNGIRIDFIIEKNGRRMPAGHKGKLIKGQFIRWLSENQINSVKCFEKFEKDGFKFDGENFIKKQEN